MNTSTALRLLEAARDDVVLASWAAVFDEHRMSPECDVSPYDCWEVLQGFVSSGVISGDDYNNVNLKASFFNGTRPTTNQIQEVLGRLKALRAHPTNSPESTMSSAKPPLSAFSNGTALTPPDRFQEVESRTRGLTERPRPSALAPSAQRPALANPLQSRQDSLARGPSMRAMAPAARAEIPSSRAPSPSGMPCRKIDASTYRGVGDFTYVGMCCGHEMVSEDLGAEEDFDIEPDDGGGMLHEFMFRQACPNCDKAYTVSCTQRVPVNPY